MVQDIILTTAYFPSIQYFSKILHAEYIYIEACENYSRQSYRNRCNILSCNGVLPLTIPIKKGASVKQIITDVRIDYSTNWQRIHLNAIISAYNKSPFYTYYSDEILKPINNNYDTLFELNKNILQVILELVHIKKEIQNTSSFIKKYDENVLDYRNSFNPKIRINSSAENIVNTYIQTFSDRFEFVPYLSILDLIFNVGPETKDYL